MNNCPICRETAETLYIDKFGRTVGCDYCIKVVDAWDFAAEREDENIWEHADEVYRSRKEEDLF